MLFCYAAVRGPLTSNHAQSVSSLTPKPSVSKIVGEMVEHSTDNTEKFHHLWTQCLVIQGLIFPHGASHL